MYEKVNPAHPDKIADRIAGALVDYAYTKAEDPRIAVEVLLGHGQGLIIAETSVDIPKQFVIATAERILRKPFTITYKQVPQAPALANNQTDGIRCGDNGIFRGVPVTQEQVRLAGIAGKIYETYGCDGKYLINGDRLIICQSNAKTRHLRTDYPDADINPLGFWYGGTEVDSGATNRKLGSDMGDSITGGGLHGKDLSKADVTLNICAWMQAQLTGKPVELSCAIGDDTVDGIPYSELVDYARGFIAGLGGFEKFAEWGLIRPGMTILSQGETNG